MSELNIFDESLRGEACSILMHHFSHAYRLNPDNATLDEREQWEAHCVKNNIKCEYCTRLDLSCGHYKSFARCSNCDKDAACSLIPAFRAWKARRRLHMSEEMFVLLEKMFPEWDAEQQRHDPQTKPSNDVIQTVPASISSVSIPRPTVVMAPPISLETTMDPIILGPAAADVQSKRCEDARSLSHPEQIASLQKTVSDLRSDLSEALDELEEQRSQREAIENLISRNTKIESASEAPELLNSVRSQIHDEYNNLSLQEDLFSSAVEHYSNCRDEGGDKEFELIRALNQHRRALVDMKRRLRTIAPFEVQASNKRVRGSPDPEMSSASIGKRRRVSAS